MQKNENRPGYKKTKVGWIPQEWDETTLESVALVERGKFSARPRNDPRYYGGQYPFLQTGDVSTSDGRVNSFSQTLNADGLAVSKLFPAHTLLITIAANIGDVAEVPFEFACPDSLVAVQTNGKSDRLWLKYFLHTKKSYFESKSTQNAQANINLQIIRPVAVQLPSLPEQEAIAGVLECWDRAIRNLELKIGNKRRIKKGLMQALLSGTKRLPAFEPKSSECRISNSEYGQPKAEAGAKQQQRPKGVAIPKDWKIVRLGDVGDFTKGKGIAKKELSENGVPCIRYGEIYTTDDFVLKVFRSFISKELAAESQRIFENDLLLAGSGETAEEIGKSIAYMHSEEAYAGGDIVIFSPDKRTARADFLSYYLNTVGREQLNKMGQGQSVVHVYPRDLKKANVHLPSLEEQQAIAEVLSTADREIEALERKLDKWLDQKKYLLNNLVTGTIRLPEFINHEIH